MLQANSSEQSEQMFTKPILDLELSNFSNCA